MKYKKIFELNKEWVKSKFKEDAHFFEKSHVEQNPDFLYIGCSDSRVPANAITGLDVGDLFVHRNIGNVISNNDMSAMSIIQYAVEQLNVKHIMVCGHYGCGGVESAMEQKSFGLLDHWLKNIRDVYREYYDELEAIDSPKQRFNRLVELNALEQAENIIKTSYVQKSFFKTGYPIVHACVYDMQSGELIDLDVDFESVLKKTQLVYKIS